jgi:hypothetical protein
VALTAVLGLLVAASLSAQSLGAVAKETEAKRKTTKPAGKVYTNDSLKSDPRDSTPAAAPAAATPSQPDVNADDKAKQDASGKQVKDEAYWRDRIKAERDALARARRLPRRCKVRSTGCTPSSPHVRRHLSAMRSQPSARRASPSSIASRRKWRSTPKGLPTSRKKPAVPVCQPDGCGKSLGDS